MLLMNECQQHRFSYFQPISLQVTENPQGHNFICTLWLWSIDKYVFSLKKMEEKSTFDVFYWFVTLPEKRTTG